MPHITGPAKYCGIIPWILYSQFQEKLPQNFAHNESDRQWLERLMHTPSITAGTFYSPQLRQELQEAVANHLMVVAGGIPTADNPRQSLTPIGPRLQGVDHGHGISSRFQKDHFANRGVDAGLAHALLLEQHAASLQLPTNSAIFWNGPNELALAKLAAEWSENNPQTYMTLEGSTSVGYINKRFEWGPAVETFFSTASAQLGMAATGHITAVCRFGLRNDSILTKTELPRMLNHMQSQLENGKPVLTDITIVVINPINSTETFAVFTNAKIVNIMTWGRDKGQDGSWINPGNSTECKQLKQLGLFWKDNKCAQDDSKKQWASQNTGNLMILPPKVRFWWTGRNTAAPAVVAKLTSDDAIRRMFNYRNMTLPHTRPGLFRKLPVTPVGKKW